MGKVRGEKPSDNDDNDVGDIEFHSRESNRKGSGASMNMKILICAIAVLIALLLSSIAASAQPRMNSTCVTRWPVLSNVTVANELVQLNISNISAQITGKNIYTLTDATISGSPAKKITFPQLSAETSTSKTETKITATDYIGKASVKLKIIEQKNLSVPYKCNCKTTQSTYPNSTKYDVTACDTCYKTEGYTAARDFDPAADKISKDIEIYEVFEGCLKMELKNGAWSCATWTDLKIMGTDITGATWWNNTYDYRYRIGSSATASWPFNINNTYAPPAWTKNETDMYLYCSVSGCASGIWAIGDSNANALSYEVDNGTDIYAGYNPADVWNSTTLRDVWNFKNATGFDSKYGTYTLSTGSGAPSSVTAVYGNGAHTDGVDDAFINSSFSISGDHTWLLYYRKDSITTNTYDRVIVENDNTGNGQNGCFLFSAIGSYNNRFAVGCWGQSESAMSPTEISVGSWYCLAMKKNSTGYSLYVNGSLIAANTQSTGTINTVYLGGQLWSGAYHNWANGTYDQIRYYTDDLTDAQISDYCKDMNNQLSSIGAEETSRIPTVYDAFAGITANSILIRTGCNWQTSTTYCSTGIMAGYNSATGGLLCCTLQEL